MSKKNISPFLSSRLLNLAKIKSAYKKDDEVFSERIISFNKRIFFSIFVIEIALLFFFRVFLDIDRFHFKEENKINENLIESYNLNKKEELLRRLIQLKTDNENLWMKKRFFNKYKINAFECKLNIEDNNINNSDNIDGDNNENIEGDN